MKIFISYRRSDDLGGVGRLFDHLEARFGQGRIFLDVDSNMPLGVDFREHIASQVEKADVVLVVIGPNWLRLVQEKEEDSADFVRIEIEMALEKGIPVVPVMMGHSQIPAENELPPSIDKLAYLNGIPLDVGADFRPHVQKLCSKLEASVQNDSSTQSRALKREFYESIPVKTNSPRFKEVTPKTKPAKIRGKEEIDWKDLLVVFLGTALLGSGLFFYSFNNFGTLLGVLITSAGALAGTVIAILIRRLRGLPVIGAIIGAAIGTGGGVFLTFFPGLFSNVDPDANIMLALTFLGLGPLIGTAIGARITKTAPN